MTARSLLVARRHTFFFQSGLVNLALYINLSELSAVSFSPVTRTESKNGAAAAGDGASEQSMCRRVRCVWWSEVKRIKTKNPCSSFI